MQVIKESQRLFPAAAIGPVRIAAENAELGGYFIPKGTRVQVGHTVVSSVGVLQQRPTTPSCRPVMHHGNVLPLRAVMP